MPYIIKFSDEFKKSFQKFKKKDKNISNQIEKKLISIIENPEHYKPLRNILAGYRRIHFRNFVLIYKIEKETIKIISLDHHDKVY